MADGHLNTGFVETPLLLPALSAHGMNNLAYSILLNETYPSWLFDVNLGATTVWKRWNSILEDGTISGTEMNSLNHYAYGSIAEWMYCYMIGFRPSMNQEVKMTIAPYPGKRLGKAEGEWIAATGTYKVQWSYDQAGQVTYRISVPDITNDIIDRHKFQVAGGEYIINAEGKW